MRNPLNRRIPREITGEIGKYLVIFLFMAGTIGFISGFLVAGNSMIQAYQESFETYQIEDGNFELDNQLEDSLRKILENEHTTIYDNYYIEENVVNNKDNESTSKVRIFVNREEVNKVCLMKGAFPANASEIAVDRMYADNNQLEIGDELEVGGIQLTISGLVALSDYSALFSDNTDMMFDALKFGTAIMTKEGFEQYSGEEGVHYSYSWVYDEEPEDEVQEKEMSDDFMKVLYQNTVIVNYIPRYLNQAIQFTGDDLGSDHSMIIVLLYILIIIIAFIFAVTTSNTISKECCIIGTLRASGYSRGELIRHYLTMPLAVTLVSAIVGNVLGYTIFKNIVASMYYSSYSLPTYTTRWNVEAFILTTLVPFLIMIVVNLFILIMKMRISPLQFLKNNLKKTKRKALRLPNFRFLTRFRLRIIFQNIPAYGMLFIGILFANVILLFGMMMSPLLTHYQEQILDNMLADYQYILKMPVETSNSEAEAYGVYSLKRATEDGESISVYGVCDNSAYVDLDLKESGVYITDGYAEKYGIKIGDTIELQEQYNDDTYSFQVEGIYEYPAALCVFMSLDSFCNVFDYEEGYFNGYFSNHEIDDIDSSFVATTITEEDLTKTSRQLTVSMGKMFSMVNVFSVVLYMLLIYLLSKLVIEKNANAISMVKILGYENGEIRRLYMTATTIIVFLSLLIGTACATGMIGVIYKAMMSSYTGWLAFYINPKVYVDMLLLGAVSYLVIERILYKRIKEIPMEEALKNVE